MIKKIRNIALDRYTTYSNNIIVKNIDNTIANLSGLTAYGKIKKSYNVDNGINFICNIPNYTDGLIEFSLPIALVNTLEDKYYVYDIVLTNNSKTVVNRVLEGVLEIIPGTTDVTDGNLNINYIPENSNTNNFIDGGIFP